MRNYIYLYKKEVIILIKAEWLHEAEKQIEEKYVNDLKNIRFLGSQNNSEIYSSFNLL